MNAHVADALSLVVRWAHLVAGIMWIGSSLFFHWLDSHLEKPATPRPGLEGTLWMVHSGGFYEVEKKLVAPSELPAHLHWFKWEAAFTWLTGFFLLVILYHAGGAVLLVDPVHPVWSAGQASAVALGTLVVCWFAYDTLWTSKLGGSGAVNPPVAVALSVLGLAAVALFFSHFLSGRAAYIHTAAVMGTCMVANVWRRIIPAQRHLVDSVRAGTTPVADLAYGAKKRSKHNHYLTYPILFIMISNHFPSTYGASGNVASVHGVGWNWAILVALMGALALLKLWLNKRDPPAAVGVGALVVATLLAVLAAYWPAPAAPTAPAVMATDTTRAAIDAATAGTVAGTVWFDGAVPPPREVTLVGGCEAGHDGPVQIPRAIVNGGHLQGAFVAIADAMDQWQLPPVPQTEVVLDQRRCLYAPRVVGARAGQPVVFLNSDALFHNVRTMTTANTSANIGMATAGTREVMRFLMPEVMLEARCDVHPWMTAFIGVKPHPFFAVTDADGAFTLTGLPPGTYSLEVWSEAGGRQTVPVEVKPAAVTRMDVHVVANTAGGSAP